MYEPPDACFVSKPLIRLILGGIRKKCGFENTAKNRHFCCGSVIVILYQLRTGSIPHYEQ